MAKIFIDAGHGGNDPGASGQGLVEKVITLAVSKRVKYHVERHGVSVIMSRTGDETVSLSQRSGKANQNSVDACISIHCNAFNGNAYGVETFTYATGANELRLAQCVHNEVLSAKIYSTNRGIKQGNLHMVREPKMAAILIEMAFIDNAKDAALLRNKQEEFAVAIATGLLKYFGIAYKGESTGKPSQPAPSGQLYRVRKTWAGAALQKGAFHDLNNAKKECDKYPGYSVFDEAGRVMYTSGQQASAPAPAPTPKKEYVNLPASAGYWNVYPLNKAPVVGNQCGKLAPQNYGGLSYEVLGKPQANVYTIQTSSFGKVNIYVGPDTSGKITNSPLYGGSSSAPKKEYVNLPASAGYWNVYPTNKAPVVGNQCGKLAPQNYGGLSYEILGKPQSNVYTIQTSSFGKVNIYVGPDTSGKITNSPLY